MAGIRKREEQRREDTWNLELIYSTDDEWEKDAKRLDIMMEEFGKQQGKLGQGSRKMLEILEEYCGISQLLEKLYVYASMRLDENTANSHYQQMEGKARTLATRLDSVCSGWSRRFWNWRIRYWRSICRKMNS